VRLGDETLLDTARGVFVPVHLRRIGYVPQSQALFPFLDVAANVAFGLPRGPARRPRTVALLEELGITHLASKRPDALSGGERQRVALARALAVPPRLLLLDEPFAAVDEEGKRVLRQVVRGVVERHAIPAVLITHDDRDAEALGDRLVRFARGRTVESGTPKSMLGASPLPSGVDGR
jgi:molybdate transport system ATP-binding protein